MSQIEQNAEEFARMLNYVADCITYTHKVQSYKDCNTCKDRKCKYRPKLGEMTRINCFAWK